MAPPLSTTVVQLDSALGSYWSSMPASSGRRRDGRSPSSSPASSSSSSRQRSLQQQQQQRNTYSRKRKALEEEEVEEKSQPKAKAAAKPKRAASATAKKSSAAAAKKQTKAPPAKRARTTRRTAVEEENDDDDGEEKEQAPGARSTRASTRRAAAGGVQKRSAAPKRGSAATREKKKSTRGEEGRTTGGNERAARAASEVAAKRSKGAAQLSAAARRLEMRKQRGSGGGGGGDGGGGAAMLKGFQQRRRQEAGLVRKKGQPRTPLAKRVQQLHQETTLQMAGAATAERVLEAQNQAPPPPPPALASPKFLTATVPVAPAAPVFSGYAVTTECSAVLESLEGIRRRPAITSADATSVRTLLILLRAAAKNFRLDDIVLDATRACHALDTVTAALELRIGREGASAATFAMKECLVTMLIHLGQWRQGHVSAEHVSSAVVDAANTYLFGQPTLENVMASLANVDVVQAQAQNASVVPTSVAEITERLRGSPRQPVVASPPKRQARRGKEKAQPARKRGKEVADTDSEEEALLNMKI